MKLETLNRWASLLFDTGKRNNLVNFRTSKLATVELVAPEISKIFSQAEHAAEFIVYDTKLEDDTDELLLNASPEDMEDIKYANDVTRMTKEQYHTKFATKLKRGYVLAYNPTGKPLLALKNIKKRGIAAIEETGVNILYLAFGFVHWTEAAQPKNVMKAPILLVPVTVINESSIEPYRIKVVDDEIIVNPTFSFKLQNEHGIQLPDIEDGEDVVAYFNRVEQLVSKLKWKVSHECHLGIFSFLKLNMYQDLKDNAEVIAESPNVLSLTGESTSPKPTAKPEPSSKKAQILELHNVVDADSSQSEAIEMVKRGKSFVLQGPPGTGKSQTITNIIAECLADGKTVLFVSEKLAALSVVYAKLKQAGLAEFCLEIHSHKSNKKQVIEELCRTLKARGSTVSGRAKQELEQKKKAQQDLDVYTEELHKVRPIINSSLYHLFDELAVCRIAPDIDYAIVRVKTKGDNFLRRAESAIERYVQYTATVGYNYRNNPWYGLKTEDISYESILKLQGNLQATLTLCQDLLDIKRKAKDLYGIDLENLSDAAVFREIFTLMGESAFISPILLATGRKAEILNTAIQMKPLAEVVMAQRAYLDEVYDNEVYQIDGQAYHKALTVQFAGAFSRLFSKEYKQMMLELRRCKLNGKKPKYADAVAHMNALRKYQDALQSFETLSATIKDSLGSGYQGVTTDFDRLFAEIQGLLDIQMDYGKLGNILKLSVENFDKEKLVFQEIAQAFASAYDQSQQAEEALAASFKREECDFLTMTLSASMERCKRCLDNTDKIDNWCEFVKLLAEIDKMALLDYVDYAIKELLDVNMMVLALRKAFYKQWVDCILRDTPLLQELSRIPHDEAVRVFKEKDELNFEINKAIIRASVSAKRPGLDVIAQGSAVSILLREGEKKRKQKSVRQLLSEIGDLALTIKPCFLMSPLSVSTFLTADMHFDVVVFDEASQIFPQDAIGSIYRGKQLVVVGDSKQMPPSNFFSTTVDMDEETDDESLSDYESILDLCATSFPQCRLKWHYRSRYEQLISFSNQNFYDGTLVTFPSAKADKRGVGVDYIYVDGVFDRQSKTNREEAERVVDLVFEHFEKHPNRSLGVVAFSTSQQDLIEKLISKRRMTDPSKNEFFKSDRAEPFFVKNLETVQGDERDTIIFSVAYAKDARGKLLLNFGPLNRLGGERRLNVAVTRAKYNVQLVTSMHYSDIDLSRTQSVGARLLREYLDYAENGVIALQRDTDANVYERVDSEFENEVCEFLRENGYDVDTQVGCSSFKVDLALKRPGSSNYVLAIECDGNTYASSKSTRDRDRLRQSILENMGWRYYRIWSTDWFRNKRAEKERLLTAVKRALEDAPLQPDEVQHHDLSFEEKADKKHFAFPEYQEVSVTSIQNKYNHDVGSIVRAILEREAPLSEEWLLKRILHLYGRMKVNSYVQEQFEKDMKNCANWGVIRQNGFLYLKDKPIPMLRIPSAKATTIREIRQISLEELAGGIKELLRQNVSAEKAGLYRFMAQQLGFGHVGDAIIHRLDEALQLIADEIEINGDMLSIK